MKIIFTLHLIVFVTLTAYSQQDTIRIYNPDTNAIEVISSAVDQAKQENKHVLIQIGGNWCPWCIKLHNFIKENEPIDSLIQADYVLIRVNYSKENKNPEIMEMLEFPQRFGFPVLVILNGEGQRLHTQNTLYLEEDEYYSEKRLKDFLLDWNRAAIDPEKYQ
jgi:thioredoxin-related protein